MQLKPLNSSLPAEMQARSRTVPAPLQIREEMQHRRSVAGANRKEREPHWHTVRQKGPRRPPGLQRQPLETQAEVGEMSNGGAPARDVHRKKARPYAKTARATYRVVCLVTGLRAMLPRFWLPDRRGPANPQRHRIACESAPRDGQGKEGQALPTMATSKKVVPARGRSDSEGQTPRTPPGWNIPGRQGRRGAKRTRSREISQ